MSLKLPTQDSAIRSLFDIRDLAAFGNPANRIKPGTGFREVLAATRAMLTADTTAVAAHMFAFRANGDLWLVKVTRRSWSKVWNFGQ
jgi:hypothetical protein